MLYAKHSSRGLATLASGSTEMPQDLTSGFLLGYIQSRIGAATALHTVDYERRSDGSTLDGSVTDGTRQLSNWGRRRDRL
jgi:hypothetical protein